MSVTGKELARVHREQIDYGWVPSLGSGRVGSRTCILHLLDHIVSLQFGVVAFVGTIAYGRAGAKALWDLTVRFNSATIVPTDDAPVAKSG